MLALSAASWVGCDVVVDFGVGSDSGAGASGGGAATSSSSASGGSTGAMSAGGGGAGGASVDPAACTQTATPAWSARLGGDNNDDVTAVAVDSKGDIYITGFTASSAFYFDEVTASAGADDGWFDMYVAKLSSDGVLLWSRLLGAATSMCVETFRQRGNGVSIGADDSLLVTGRFDCTLDFVGDGTGNCSEASGCLTSNGASPAVPPNQIAPDAFLAKLGPDGSFLWGKALGDKLAQSGWDVAAAPDGGSFLFGAYQGSLALSPGVSLPALTGPTAAGFLAKLDTNGKAVWGRSWVGFCSGVNAASCRLAADAAGNVYFVGEYPTNAAPVDLGTGPLDCGCEINSVIGRLNSDGSTAWARCVGTCEPSVDGEVGALAIAVSKDGGRVYTAGRVSGDFSLQDGEATQALAYDAFVASYDLAGNPLAKRYFGLQRDQEAFGVDTGPDGSVILAGRFRGVLDLEACFINQADSLALAPDGFLVGLDANLTPHWGYRFGSGLPQMLRSPRITTSGQVIVAGTYTGTIDLGVGPQENRGTDPTTIDVLVAKLLPPAP